MFIDTNLPYSHRFLFLEEKNYYIIFHNFIKFVQSVNEKYQLYVNGMDLLYVFHPRADEYYLNEQYKDDFFEFLKSLPIDKKIIENCIVEIDNYISKNC